MDKTVEWPSLRGYGLRLVVATLPDKTRCWVILGEPERIERYRLPLKALKFSPTKGGFLVRREMAGLTKQLLRAVFPDMEVVRISPMAATWQVGGAPADSGREREQNAELAKALPLGYNAAGEMVYEGAVGRFLRRGDTTIREEGVTTQVEFLRAPPVGGGPETEAAVAAIADGVILGIVEHGLRYEWRDVRTLAKRVWGEGADADFEALMVLQEAIEAAGVRYLAKVDNTDQAFARAVVLDEHMPVQAARSSERMALMQFSTPYPIAVAAARVLGDVKGKVIYEPTVGNGSLVATLLNAGAKVIGNELASSRHASFVRLIEQYPAGEHEARLGDATQVKAPAADLTIANPPFGGLAQAYVRGDKLKVTRLDQEIVLRTLEARKPEGLSVFLMAGDYPLKTAGRGGEVVGGSRYMFNWLSDQYVVHDVVEVDGALYRKMGAEYPIRLVVVGERRPAPERGRKDVPDRLRVLRSYEELNAWSTGLAKEVAAQRAHATNAVAEIAQANVASVAPSPESEDGGGELIAPAQSLSENAMQSPYRALSQLGEATTMIPRYLVGAQNEAFARVRERVPNRDVDAWVADCLEWTPEEMARYLAVEQIDAVALALLRVENRQGFLCGDATGIGKGRVMAAAARFAVLRGWPVVFLTEKPNLFSDLWRDIEQIGSAEIFRPFVLNAGVPIMNLETNTRVWPATAPSTLRQVMEGGQEALQALDCNLVMATYSQFARAITASPKPEWLQKVSEGGLLLADEAHNAAGESLTHEAVFQATAGARAVVYSSATFAKGAKNMVIYWKLFARPGGEDSAIAVENLAKTLDNGGEPLLEAVTAMLVQDGAMIRREHDMSGLVIEQTIDEDNRARNEMLSDRLADVLALLGSFGGDVNRMVNVRNKAMEKAFKALPAEAKAGKRLGLQKLNFGSRLYAVMRQFMLTISIDGNVAEALTAIRDGQKPVFVLEQTFESLIQALEAEESGAAPDAVSEAQVRAQEARPAPTFRDILWRLFERMQTVVQVGGYGAREKVAVQGLCENEEAVEALKETLAAIEQRIMNFPELPAYPLDYLKMRLRERGFECGEISGRSTCLSVDANGMATSQPLSTNRLQEIFDFNSGRKDAVLLTRAGMTGLSLHASREFRDQRQRRLQELQIANNVAERLQAFGRVNRRGQVCPPIIASRTSGLPAETRILSMQNGKLRRLQAATTSNRESSLARADVPDLLNWVGNRVAMQWIEANAGTAARLGIVFSEEEAEETYYINQLLMRMPLLPVAEQRQLLDDLDREYRNVMQEMEARGLNPFKLQESDWGARVIAREVFIGVERDHYWSEFDRPVYLEEIEYEVVVDPLPYEEIETRRARALAEMMSYRPEGMGASDEIGKEIDRARAEAGKNLSEGQSRNYYRDPHYADYVGAAVAWAAAARQGRRLAQTQLSAWFEESGAERFKSLEEALCAKEGNMGKSLQRTIDFLGMWATTSRAEDGAPLPGTLVRTGEVVHKDGREVDEKLLVVGVKLPRAGSEHRLGQWELEVMPIGGGRTDIRRLSLHGVVQAFEELRGGAVSRLRADELAAQTGAVTPGRRTVRRAVLSGNLYRATEFAVQQRMGTAAVWTDQEGHRIRSVVLPLGVGAREVKAVPVQLSEPPVVEALAKRFVANEQERNALVLWTSSRAAPEEGTDMVVRVKDGVAEMMCPGAKAVGGRVYLDEKVREICGEFRGTRQQMRSESFGVEALGNLAYRMAALGYTFYAPAVHRPLIAEVLAERASARQRRAASAAGSEPEDGPEEARVAA